MNQPLLSIGMIVKNEERCLEKCLNALEPLRQAIPCELVIADTGSTDKTKEIASRYADILFDFEWVNDFSAARNAVIDKCNGKWYLTVDADEYLLPDIKEIVDFLNSPLADKKNLASIVQRNYKNSDMKGVYTDFNALRMVRMATGRRYSGTIHEHFGIKSVDECHALTNTIFDHDGYTKITPKHLEEKEKRNLTLLEAELSKEPKSIKNVLQCLESASKQPQKRKYYTDYAMKMLKEKNISDPNWETCAPACAYQVTNYADYDGIPDLMEWYDWVFENFTKSDKIQIDVKYMYALRLYSQEKYSDTIKAGKEYLSALSTYQKNKNKTNIFTFMNPLTRVHKTHEITANVVIANSMLQINRFDEAKKILEKTDLTQGDNLVITTWIDSIILMKNVSAKTIAEKVLSNFLKKYNENTVDMQALYDYIVAVLTSKFSSSNINTDECNVFSEVPGTIGLSAKIAKSKTKEEAEKLLYQIENWEEFMPLALKQALLLKADLPKAFYTMSSSRLGLLTNDLSKATEEISNVIINHYCNEEILKEFPQISFIFNLLSNSLFNNTELNKELRLALIDKFLLVADMFLNTCYNPDLLSNENCMFCLPEVHLFSWYLVKANKLKESNPLEYIKTLRTAINKVPQSKQIVEFLIDEFKKEEEQKKQEQIKNAAPELVAMAEQLKIMLKAFPENSPELLAIKQSPMYKQVAFLIEE